MADFIECFLKDPNGEDTLKEVSTLFAQAEKNVHTAAKLKYGDEYQVGGDEFGNEIHALLMTQLSEINLLDPEFFEDLLNKAEQWYVPFDQPESAKCGAVSAPLLAALKDAREIQFQNQCHKLCNTCIQCRDRIDSVISGKLFDEVHSGVKFKNAVEMAHSQREILNGWIAILEDSSLSVGERFARVQQSIAANRKSFVVTKNISDELRAQLAEDSQQAGLFHHPFLICLQENMFWEASNEAVLLHQNAYKKAHDAIMITVSPTASDEEKKRIAPAIDAKLKELMVADLQANVKREDVESLSLALSAWKFEVDDEKRQYCEAVKEVMGAVLDECPAYENCEKLMIACLDYASELNMVVQNDESDAKKKEVAASKLIVVESLMKELNSQQLPSERLKNFTSLYQSRESQRTLYASSDTASDKFRKIVDSILLLFQKGGLQKISGLWKKAEGLLERADTATRAFLNAKKK